MSETHKLTSAEPLGEQAMLVTTRTLGLGNRSTLSEPENAKIWLKLPEVNGQRDQVR